MGTSNPVKTKHKLMQNPVCVEETNRCSELGGRAPPPSDFISCRDPSVVGWMIARLAVGEVGRRDPRSPRVRGHARTPEFGTRVSGAREVEK